MKKASLIVANSEHSADMFYATGFRAPDPFIYFSYGSRKAMILSALEFDRGKTESHQGIKIFRYEDFIKNGRRGMGDVLRVLAKSLKVEQFRVPADFPLALADFLRKHKIDVVARAKGFFPERKFKNEKEIEYLREAQRITALGMQRAEEILRASKLGRDGVLHWSDAALTSEILRAEINIELIRNGGFAASTIVAGALQGAEPHNEGSGPLYKDSPIVIDIFPKITATGYHGDMTRTFVKGKAPEIVNQAYDALFKTRETCKMKVKTGVIPAEVHNDAVQMLNDAGFPTGRREDGKNFGFFHGLGHGLGLEVHEAPYLSPRDTTPLRGGEVVTVEPGLYYPEWGGIRLEDVVVVREDHAECLTFYPNKLEVD